MALKKNGARIDLGSSSHLYLLPGRTSQPSCLCVDFSIVNCYRVPVYIFVLEFVSSFTLRTSGKGKQKECKRQTGGRGDMRCCLWNRMWQLSSWSQHSCHYLQETCRRSGQLGKGLTHRAPPPLETDPLRFLGTERQLWLWMAKERFDKGGR